MPDATTPSPEPSPPAPAPEATSDDTTPATTVETTAGTAEVTTEPPGEAVETTDVGADSAGQPSPAKHQQIASSDAEADRPATARSAMFSAPPFQPGPALWGIAVLTALFLISAGVFVGTLLDGPRSPKEDAATSAPSQVDVGFLRDMQTHHAQAVQMAVLIRDRTDDEEIRKVALDIELTQQQQIGQMYGLLASWGESQSNPNPMSWMNSDTDDSNDSGDPHGAMSDMPGTPGTSDEAGSAMPGMASAADLKRLGSLRGKAAERLFLELMIAHHQGGIPMATAAAESADEAWVRTLAQSIVDAQSAEITALQAMLDDRGGPTG